MRRLLLLALLVGCGGGDDGGGETPDAPPPDAAGPIDKAANCADTFGDQLTNSFGRLDGTLIAIVEPGNEACAMPNSTHVVLQVQMNGAVYRMVANVLSTSSDPHVWLGDTHAALVGPAYAEGWHPGVALDYVDTLHVSKSAFTEADEDAAVARLLNIDIDVPVSIFATSSGGAQAASAHLIHRNAPNADGAIVIDPTGSSPQYLLTAFPEQTF